MPMTTPAVAFLNFVIRSLAACFKPLRSSVPVTRKTMTKVHMLRLETKLEPSVSSSVTRSMPLTSAVTTAAAMMIRMESIFITNPTMTMTIPRSFNNSTSFILSFHCIFLRISFIIQ